MMSEDLSQDILQQAQERFHDRMETEIRGAWRAGYDYLHVYNREVTDPIPNGMQPTLTLSVFPSYCEHPQKRYIGSYTYLRTYVLDSDVLSVKYGGV